MAVKTSAPRFEFGAQERTRLTRHIDQAAKRARGGSGVLASVTFEASAEADPAAVAVAGRMTGEPWFCIDQPERGFALAAIGSILRLDAEGPERFHIAARQWRDLAAAAVADPPDGPAGSGLIAVGGFAFDHYGAAAPHWQPYGPATLDVPEIALARGANETRLTLAALVEHGDDAEAIVERLASRLGDLDPQARLPLWDPHPAGPAQIAGAMAPEHYEDAVARAVEMIGDGELEKVVLAREVHVHVAAGHDPGAVFGVLRESFPSCHCVAAGRGDSTLLSVTPELLVRREGSRASTVALAGSTGRSADPAVDSHLGEQLLNSKKNRSEQEIVTRRIRQALEPLSSWVTAPDEPELVKVANIQHLATPVRAQLRLSVSAIELAGALHPTPAVGGEPLEHAQALIPRLEGLDRGWYAGPIGWTDANEDGEFFVALRCALLDGELARCYAGVGVVAGSDPATELAETEVKLQAVLPALGA
jgi:salicylate biosynthesis isochorismate synthase/menaquinone-specific isochorismate synthase